MRTPRAGFTLIELLVVIGIIAVLAALTMSGISRFRRTALATDTSARMSAVLNGLATYSGGQGSSAESLMVNLPLGGVKQFTTVFQIVQMRRLSTSTLFKNNGEADGTPPAGYPPYIHGDEAERNRMCEQLFEVLPPAFGTAIAGSWFTTQWPFVWPETDWDKPIPGVVPPILWVPWGKRGQMASGVQTQPGILASVDATNSWVTYDAANTGPNRAYIRFTNTANSLTKTARVGPTVNGTRSDGSTVTIDASLPLPYDVGLFSPLASIPLLQAAGLLPGGTTGEASYRSDRSPSRPWNDRWGNPLVVVYALYQAPRFYDGALQTWEYRNSKRDLLLKSAMETYQFNRAVYVAVAAVGPLRRHIPASGSDPEPLTGWTGNTPLPTWTAAQDNVVLRALWRQIRTTTRAQEWTESGFDTSPWRGVRNVALSEENCLLTAPIEIK